jgi:anti-sigma factor RsiW
MTTPPHDWLPPEWLAAYADGELPPRDRARVESWLSAHAEARDLAEAQESLSPTNGEFWEAVRAPAPAPAAWATTLAGIHARAPAAPVRRQARWLGTVGLMATAATLLLALPAADGPEPPDLPPVVDCDPRPSPDDEPYAMADEDDIRIVSLPEEAADLLVVGRHPMGDGLLLLAPRSEVVFLGMGNDPEGRFPDPPDDPDAAVVWAPREP